MTISQKICWTITDVSPGMKSQVEGLADATCIPTIHKTCQRRWPWGWLGWSGGRPLAQLTAPSDPLTPPWPDLVISCGRRSAPLALAIKRASNGKTFCVHIQNPLHNLDAFDLIVSPEHDGLRGPNVISTTGAIHKVTPQKLADGIKAHSALFERFPRPLSTVLIGGSTNRYKMPLKAMETIIAHIFRIQSLTGGGVLVTPSFRTPYREVLGQALANKPTIFLAEIEKHNPYFAMLGLADFVFVTDDSVNMVSEACVTGKPVYILPLLGHPETKPKKFVQGLVEKGTVRLFDGSSVDSWTYPPFNDTARVAAVIREKMGLSSVTI